MPPIDIFLSFRSHDLKLARAIDEILRASGLEVWFYPRSSPGGKHFPDEINEALTAAKTVLVVLTPNFYSDSIATKGEFDYAWLEGKLRVIRFEGARLPPLAAGLVCQDCDLTPENERFTEVVLAAANGTAVDGREPTKRIDFELVQRGTTAPDFEGREVELALLDQSLRDDNCSVVCIIAGGGFGKSTVVKKWIDRGKDEPGSVRRWISSGYAYSFASQGAETEVTPSSDPFFESALLHFRDGARLEPDPAKRPGALLASLRQQRRPLLVLDGLEPFQKRADEPSPGLINNKPLEQFVNALVFEAKDTTTVITSRVMPANLVQHIASGRVRVIAPSEPPHGDPGPVRAIDLGKLNRPASIALLRSCLNRVTGSPTFSAAELESFAEECEDHPLLLSLVGPALSEGHYDLQQLRRHRDPEDEGNEDVGFSGTVKRLVESQLKDLGTKARAVLYSVCLFDEPVDGKSLRDLLIDRATIPVFTQPLQEKKRFSETSFREGAQKLEKAAILIPEKRDPAGKEQPHAVAWTFGVHPVIQAGIRMTLTKERKADWQAANATIYRSLVRSVKTRQPSDKDELRRLYAAIPHGLRSGRGPQTGWMYGKRCMRGYRAYATNQLGMIGDDVEAMSHYFVGRWLEVRGDLGMRNFHKGIAYSWAGLVLIGTNQLVTGLRLMETGIEHATAAGAFVTASRTARHLAFISALLGKRDKALKLAEDAIGLLAKRRPPWIWLLDVRLIIMPHQRMTAHANLGSVHHYFGEMKQAEEMFQKAEAFQVAAQPRYPKLRAIWGYRYADLLLDLGRFEEADERFTSALVEPNEPRGWGEGVFAAPLVMLGFIRSKVRQADHFGKKQDWEKVTAFSRELQAFGKSDASPNDAPDAATAASAGSAGPEASTKTKRAKKEEYNMRLDVLTPAFRSGIAGVARLSGDLAGAMREVEEAERSAKIAETCLFNVEIAVERARIHLAMGARDEARAVLTKVRDKDSHVAYRRAELERLLAELQ